MRYYIATAFDGTVFTRSTASRAYTHCVVAFIRRRAATPEEVAKAKGLLFFHPEASEGWSDAEWCGRYDLAQKNARRDRTFGDPRRVCHVIEILDAVEVDRRAFEAAKNRETQAA